MALARRQHGVVTYPQLLAAGLSRDAIRYRVTSGWLRRVHRGVYLMGVVDPPLARAMAAVLCVGEGSLLSHHPSAVLWGLRPPRAGEMQLDDRELSRAVDEARVNRLASDVSLNEQLSRYPHHRGTAALRRALGEEPALTRSVAERRLLELIRKARLPPPQSNTRVCGYEVDLLWPDHPLIVEVDGYAFHSSRAAFERDRRRDAELQSHGYRVLRVTWRQITDETAELIVILARATAAPHTPKR